MKKVTIYDYVRMCKSNKSNCAHCPLSHFNNGTEISCSGLVKAFPDKANEIILNFCKEHPAETRQDRFLKMFPKALLYNGVLKICPKCVDENYKDKDCDDIGCIDCQKEYWLAEVDENDA